MYVTVQIIKTQLIIMYIINVEAVCKKQQLKQYLDLIKESQALCEARYYNKYYELHKGV